MPKSSIEIEDLIIREAESIAASILIKKSITPTASAIERLLSLKPEILSHAREWIENREKLFSSAIKAVGIQEPSSAPLDFSDLF